MWLIAALAAAGCLASGLLTPAEALATTRTVGPVLAFLAAITVLAELADEAGLFDLTATLAARAAGGRTRRLFLLVAVLGTITTILLSLDTTAVLLTPVVLALAQSLELSPVPFALLAVWLANTASLLLPVSNLTNLLAIGPLHTSATAFATRMALPELVAVSISVGVLLVRFRAQLAGRYPVPPRPRPEQPALLALAGLCALALAPGVLLGLAPWTVALPAAAVLAAGFARVRPGVLRAGLLPWRLLILTEGLFLVVTAAGRHGLDALLRQAAGTGVLRTAAVGAAASNAVNNLPAFLALRRVVAPPQLYGLLLGTDTGPLVLLYGSLATLLWRERCRARGVHISGWQFARLGLVAVPLLLVGSWLALQVTAGGGR